MKRKNSFYFCPCNEQGTATALQPIPRIAMFQNRISPAQFLGAD